MSIRPKELETVPEELLDRLRRVSTASMWSALANRGVQRTYMRGISSLVRLGTGRRVAGRAVTVRYLPTREDVLRAMSEDERSAQPFRQAIESLEPNDLLVVDAMGYLEGGVIGDIYSMRIKHRGAAGAVIDGAVRDSAAVRDVDLPVFAKGVHPAPICDFLAGIHHGLISTEMNVAIQCGGVLVLPGDIILADDDGILVVPRALAEPAVDSALSQEDKEAFQRAKLQQGLPMWEVSPLSDALREEYEGLQPPKAQK